jgi:hypothetical protein
MPNLFDTGIVYNKTKVLKPRIFTVTVAQIYQIDIESTDRYQASQKALEMINKDFLVDTKVIKVKQTKI